VSRGPFVAPESPQRIRKSHRVRINGQSAVCLSNIYVWFIQCDVVEMLFIWENVLRQRLGRKGSLHTI